ncbi:hypothetical protein MMC25_000671 [Agyrium rufum]|nr:hypothetical protein [Agyrium rufum]
MLVVIITSCIPAIRPLLVHALNLVNSMTSIIGTHDVRKGYSVNSKDLEYDDGMTLTLSFKAQHVVRSGSANDAGDMTAADIPLGSTMRVKSVDVDFIGPIHGMSDLRGAQEFVDEARRRDAEPQV